MSAFDKQEGGNHYKLMMIQPAEYILANNLGYCEGNVIKYVSRWRTKARHGPNVEDLRKAKHYLDMLIEREIQPTDKNCSAQGDQRWTVSESEV